MEPMTEHRGGACAAPGSGKHDRLAASAKGTDPGGTPVSNRAGQSGQDTSLGRKQEANSDEARASPLFCFRARDALRYRVATDH
jgi:hypothetical protein